MKGALLVLVLLAALLAVGWWNVDVAATTPHAPWLEELLHETVEHAVRRDAAEIEAPALDDAAMIADGASHYFPMCEGCHAGPGVDASELAQGLYPAPPTLHEEAEWSDAELFWILKNGIKASGMPAYGPTHDDAALWGIVAFVRTLPGMTPEAYEPFRPAEGSSGHHDHGAHEHGSDAEEATTAPAHEHSGHDHSDHAH